MHPNSATFLWPQLTSTKREENIPWVFPHQPCFADNENTSLQLPCSSQHGCRNLPFLCFDASFWFSGWEQLGLYLAAFSQRPKQVLEGIKAKHLARIYLFIYLFWWQHLLNSPNPPKAFPFSSPQDELRQNIRWSLCFLISFVELGRGTSKVKCEWSQAAFACMVLFLLWRKEDFLGLLLGQLLLSLSSLLCAGFWC